MINVSLIIPCYNSGEYLGKCIESIKQQKEKNFEVVFIDDASTDNTLARLNEFKNSSIISVTILKNQHNRGPGYSRNKAISHARGKYIAFCDSDDYFSTDLITKLNYEISNKENDIFLYGYKKDINGKIINTNYINEINMYTSKNDIIAHCLDSLCLMCIKREMFNDIKLPNLYNGEDVVAVYALMFKSSSIKCIPDDLYVYKMRKNSLSTSIDKELPYKLVKVYSKIKNLVVDDSKLIEYIGIKIVLYGAVLNGCKAGLSAKKIKIIIEKFETDYPNWADNLYIKKLNFSKKIFLKACKKNNYALLVILSKIHKILTA